MQSIIRNIDFNDATLTMDDVTDAVEDDGSRYKDAEDGPQDQPMFEEAEEEDEEEDGEDEEEAEEEDEEEVPLSARRPPSDSRGRSPDDRDGTGAYTERMRYGDSSEDEIEEETPQGSIGSVVSSNFGRSRSVSQSNSQGFMAAASHLAPQAVVVSPRHLIL